MRLLILKLRKLYTNSKKEKEPCESGAQKDEMKIVRKEISLLTKEEYEKNASFLRWFDIQPVFWLKDAASEKSVYAAGGVWGNVTETLSFLHTNVHPLLVVAVLGTHLYPGDTLLDYAGCNWIVLDALHNTEGTTARLLSLTPVAHRCFDSKEANFESSEIKSWLEEWLEYATVGVEDEEYETMDCFERVKK